jgi:hypothetical protein
LRLPAANSLGCRPEDAATSPRLSSRLSKRQPANRLYGDRDGFIVDPFGHGWTIATHVEDVTTDEMMRRISLIAE